MPSAENLLAGLDPEQRLVATSFDQPVVVCAGAGTGKTRAITHRIAYGALIGRLEPFKTLAVTFTTKAAGEMRHRLAELGVIGVQARTFHATALRISQYFWPKVYRCGLPVVCTNKGTLVSEAARLLGLDDTQALVRDLASEISWAKTCNVLPSQYQQIGPLQGRAVAGVDPETVARVMQAYEQVKKTRQQIDFDDILLCTVALLYENPDVADAVRSRYQHLVVDEFQDLNPVQYRLLQFWSGERSTVCVVGDPRQSIHGFAGASPRYFDQFKDDHPGYFEITMYRDYRSSRPIVDLANRVIEVKQHAATNHLKLVSTKSGGPQVTFQPTTTDLEQAESVVSWLQGLHRAGVPWREMSILYRVRAQSAILETVLTDAGIPYQMSGSEHFFERREVKQALRALSDQLKASRTGEDPIEEFKAVLGGLGWMVEAPNVPGNPRQYWESWSALLQFAQDQYFAHPEWEFDDLVRTCTASSELNYVPEMDGVTLSTLHSSKGLEWQAVALFGVDDLSLPFAMATTPEQLEEERRLLYVGITRAKTWLMISWSVGLSGARQPSRFLAEVIGQRPDAHPPLTLDAKPPTKTTSLMSARCRICGRRLSHGSEFKTGRHRGCPPDFSEELYRSLSDWRASQAAEASLPTFAIFTDATLEAIATAEPYDARQLLEVNGVGLVKLDKYGEAILQIIEYHRMAGLRSKRL